MLAPYANLTNEEARQVTSQNLNQVAELLTGLDSTSETRETVASVLAAYNAGQSCPRLSDALAWANRAGMEMSGPAYALWRVLGDAWQANPQASAQFTSIGLADAKARIEGSREMFARG